MSDTLYIDIETAVTTYLQADGWLGNPPELIHRHPLSYIPNYRQAQLPAIAVAVESEAAEQRPAHGTVERSIGILLEFTHAGADLNAVSERLLRVAARARHIFRARGPSSIGSLPSEFAGLIHQLSLEDADVDIGTHPSLAHVVQFTCRLRALRIEELPDGASGIPAIEANDEMQDVKAAVEAALAADATLSAIVGQIRGRARSGRYNITKPQYPGIDVIIGGEEDEAMATFEKADRVVPVTVAVLHRGGQLSAVEDTVKQILAGIRRVFRTEAMNGAPLGGAAVDVVNGRMDLLRGSPESEEIDQHTIIGITRAAVALET